MTAKWKENAEPGSDPNQMGKDGTAVGEGASAAAADKAITGMAKDKDPKGSAFAKLTLKSSKQTKTSVKLSWKKVSKAKKKGTCYIYAYAQNGVFKKIKVTVK